MRRILDRKSADVTLAANDILYVPTNGKLKTSASVMNHEADWQLGSLRRYLEYALTLRMPWARTQASSTLYLPRFTPGESLATPARLAAHFASPPQEGVTHHAPRNPQYPGPPQITKTQRPGTHSATAHLLPAHPAPALDHDRLNGGRHHSLVVLVCAIASPINEGSAVIAIDRQAAPETIGADRLLSTGDDQFMATQQNLIRGDTILRPVANRFSLLAREHQLRRYFFWRYSPATERRIKEAPVVLKHLKIQRNPNTYLLTITYRDRDPMIAARVANAIADSYLRDIFETRIREAGRLTSSMERQLIDLKLKMESTHNALMVYQRDLGTADPEQKTSVLVAKLQALNTENSAAVADRIAKEAIYREAQGGLPARRAGLQPGHGPGPRCR